MLFIVATTAWAQPAVQGTVRDSNRQPVPFCNVYAQREGVPIRLTTTDESGSYALGNLGTDSCELVVTSVGYKKHRFAFLPGTSPLTIDIVLLTDTVALDQVIVHAESPIQNRGDTVVYDATYFATGHEVALADLLKKLPGLSVDDKGKVKFQGKDIKKINVEGDDLFESNYQLLTKNLSADLVEEVQVLQNYSDNALLKGIEDSDDVALNLTLRKDRRKVLFGDVRAGSNFNDRYEGKANLVSFLDKAKFYALGNLNNLGNDPTGDVEELQRGSEESHVVGDRVSSEYLVPVTKPYISQFRADRYTFNQASFGSLNAILKPARKVSIKLLGYMYRDQIRFTQAQATDYYTPVDTVAFREQTVSVNTENLSHLQGSVLYQLLPQMHLSYRGRMSTSDGSVEQQSNLNQNPVAKVLDYSGVRHDHHLNITRKFTEREAVTVDLRYLDDGRPQQFFSDGNLVGGYFPSAVPSDSLYQNNDLPTDFLGGEINYFRKLTLAKLGVRAGYKQTGHALLSQLRSAAADLTKNELKSTQREGYGEVYYAWRKGGLTLTPSASYQYQDVTVSDRPTSPLHFFNPKLGVLWKISARSNVSAVYSRGNNASTTVQQMRNPLLKDYNLLAINDDRFRTFVRNTYMVNYQLGDWMSRFSLLATLFHQELPNDYLGDVDVEPNYTVITTNQLADRKLTSFSLMMDRFFKSIYTNLKIDWRANRSEFMTSTEGVTARTVANGHNLDISLRSALPGSFNAHAGHVLQASFTQSELVEASNYSSLFYVDGYITGLKQRLNMTLHFERYELLSVEGRPTFHFLDVFARFRIRQDKQFLVFVNARNLLNETVYGQRAVSPQGVAVTANQLMPRYVLLGLEIRW
jgi:hypothetical protein